MIILRKLATQQKNQRAFKNQNRILKQTHDIKLAESLLPITKSLEKVNKYIKKLGDVIKKSTSENENNQEIVPVETHSDNSAGDNMKILPNNSIFSDLMANTLGRLRSGLNYLRIKSSPSGASILGVLI